MRTFYTQSNIGTAKYVVNFHDGIKKNLDGSTFFDIRLFKNKKKMAQFIKSLRNAGYTEKGTGYHETESHGTDCKHPPERLFSWYAFDGTLCVCCCVCGSALKGGAE